MISGDPLETALVVGGAGAVGAIVGFLAGVATVIALLAWYVA